MKKILKIIAIIVAIIITIIAISIGISALKIFIIGDVKDVSSVGAAKIEVNDKHIFFYVVFGTSADVMSTYSYRIVDDVVYIKMRSAIVGVLEKSSVNIKGDFSSINKIILEDKEEEKVIWEK